MARLLLIADSESIEGITELQEAVREGFDDFETLELLLEDNRISVENRNEIRIIITTGLRAAEENMADTVEEEVDEIDPFAGIFLE